MADKKRHSGTLKLLGGRLCLDFINTLDWRGAETPVEFLNTYQDLVVWSRHAGICTPGEARRLATMAKGRDAAARQVRQRAVELRETMYRIFSAISQNKNPSKKDLAGFNRQLAASMHAPLLVRAKDGYSLDTIGDKARLDWVFNPIVCSAAELLVSAELQNIKSCADPACGWLFLDTSRNKRRRWCDMQDCGNRAKASRFYKKKQQK
jgi:predicted RNA-binding Zn ribbon-like protein